MKVFVTFGGLSWQKGSAAQLVSLAAVARAIQPDVELVLESHAYDLDAPPARELGIALVGHPGSGERSPNEGSYRLLLVHLRLMLWAALLRIGCDLRGLVRNHIAEALLDADLIADLSGDSYRDRPGGIALAHTLFLLSAVMCGKRVVIVSQSLGPFRWYSRLLTRMCLNRVHRIYTRERRTIDLLSGLGVAPARIALAPDVAFCLPAAPDETVRRLLPDAVNGARARSQPVIGISTSSLLADLQGAERYVQTMARITRFLRRRYHAIVLLIPHVVTPRGWGQDDSDVACQVAKAAGDRDAVFTIGGDPSAPELKGIIARCDLFLGARMHAAIAALSSDVPTIMLSWSHKYSGLMGEIGLEEFVWETGATAESLERLIEVMWDRRGEIRSVLQAYNATARTAVHTEVKRMIGSAPVTPMLRTVDAASAGRGV